MKRISSLLLALTITSAAVPALAVDVPAGGGFMFQNPIYQAFIGGTALGIGIGHLGGYLTWGEQAQAYKDNLPYLLESQKPANCTGAVQSVAGEIRRLASEVHNLEVKNAKAEGELHRLKNDYITCLEDQFDCLEGLEVCEKFGKFEVGQNDPRERDKMDAARNMMWNPALLAPLENKKAAPK